MEMNARVSLIKLPYTKLKQDKMDVLALYELYKHRLMIKSLF